jgi:hypothetical protein
LPQRIPAAPDVPDVPGGDEPDEQYVDPVDLARAALAGPELARIATHLRYDEDLVEEQPTERPAGFDFNEVVAAVKKVPGVRDAGLRPNPGGVHTLRLDLADGADPADVSRRVARLLKQKMGLAAEPRRPSSATSSAAQSSATQPGTATSSTAQSGATPSSASGPAAAKASAVTSAGPGPGTASPTMSGFGTTALTEAALGIPRPARSTEQFGGRSDERSRQRHAMPPVRSRGEGDGEPDWPGRQGGLPRVVLDQVQVRTLGLDATVEVRLTSGAAPAIGVASGPAVDGYMLRLSAVAAANAVDQLIATVDTGDQPGRCWVEHASVVPFGSCEVAVVVVLLVFGGVVEQLSGSAVVAGDPRQAVVRAMLASVNRRLDALLG